MTPDHRIIVGDCVQCVYCDAGDDLSGIKAAVAAGWRDVHYVQLEGRDYSFVGLCPVCYLENERGVQMELSL